MKLSPGAVATMMVFAALPRAASAYEISKTSAGGFYHWASPTVTYRIGPEFLAHFGAIEGRATVDAAAAAWSGLPGVPTIVISDWPASPYVADGERANGIYLVPEDQWIWDAGQLAFTESQALNISGRMLRADICVNASKPLVIGAGAHEYDLQSVLTHEFGHALGLDENTIDMLAVMSPRLRAGDMRRELTEDDIAGVVALYKDPWKPTIVPYVQNCQALQPGSDKPRSLWDLAWVCIAIVGYFVWLRRSGQ